MPPPSQAHGPAAAAKGLEHSLCRGSAKRLAAFSLLPTEFEEGSAASRPQDPR